MFGTPSHNDEHTTEPQDRVMWDPVKPIWLEEILATLRKSKDGAAGIDRISCDDIRKLNPRALQTHFNLWLYAGYQLAEFRHSRTVLIPKVAVPVPSRSPPLYPGCSIDSCQNVYLNSWHSSLDKGPLLKAMALSTMYFCSDLLLEISVRS